MPSVFDNFYSRIFCSELSTERTAMIDLSYKTPSFYFSDQITLCGLTATGRSTISRDLYRIKMVLGDDHLMRCVSAGSIAKRMAKQLGMTIEEFTRYSINVNNDVDRITDEETANYGRQNMAIIEGRLVPMLCPHSYKVKLIRALKKRAECRMMTPEFKGKSLRGVMDAIEQRDENDRERFQKMYTGYEWGEDKFDLVIDTGSIDEISTMRLIEKSHEAWRNHMTASGHEVRWTIM